MSRFLEIIFEKTQNKKKISLALLEKFDIHISGKITNWKPQSASLINIIYKRHVINQIGLRVAKPTEFWPL